MSQTQSSAGDASTLLADRYDGGPLTSRRARAVVPRGVPPRRRPQKDEALYWRACR